MSDLQELFAALEQIRLAEERRKTQLGLAGGIVAANIAAQEMASARSDDVKSPGAKDRLESTIEGIIENPVPRWVDD